MIRYESIWKDYLQKKIVPKEPVKLDSSQGKGVGNYFLTVAEFKPAPEPSSQSLDELVQAEHALNTIISNGDLDYTYKQHAIRIIKSGDQYDNNILNTYNQSTSFFEDTYNQLKQATGEVTARKSRKKTRDLAQKISNELNIIKIRDLSNEIKENKSYKQFQKEDKAVQHIEREMNKIFQEYNCIDNDSLGQEKLKKIKRRIQGSIFKKGLMSKARKIQYIEGEQYLKKLIRDINHVLSQPPTHQESYTPKTEKLLVKEKVNKNEYEQLTQQIKDIKTGIEKQVENLQKEIQQNENKKSEKIIPQEPHIVKKYIEKKVPIEKKVYLLPENKEIKHFPLTLIAKTLDVPFSCTYLNSLIESPAGRSWEQRLKEFKKELEAFKPSNSAEKEYVGQLEQLFEESINHPPRDAPLNSLKEIYQETKKKLIA